MNCKPGDLAVVVGGERVENIGKVVTVLRPYEGRKDCYRLPADWVIEFHGRECVAADCFLRPIRPDGITDEEVRDLYLPKPVKEVA